MLRLLFLALCLFLLSPSFAVAEEAPAEEQTEEQWLKGLRGSKSYRDGQANVRKYVEAAFDLGAIAGASHWEDMHKYYIGLARAKGCEKGKRYAEGPIKACHRVSGPEPKILGTDYEKGMTETTALAKQTMYPNRVERVLVVLYEYGYVQGLKHGVRVHNDEMQFKQTYYRSCMTRANHAKGEDPCAKGSKTWADALLEGLLKRIEGHGLPARTKEQ